MHNDRSVLLAIIIYYNFSLQEMCQRPKFMVDPTRLVSQGNGVVSTGGGGGGSGSGEPARNGTVAGGGVGGGRCGVEPGELGDHSFLAAVSSLTLTPKFLDRVVPLDQSFDTTTSYCGLFRLGYSIIIIIYVLMFRLLNMKK